MSNNKWSAIKEILMKRLLNKLSSNGHRQSGRPKGKLGHKIDFLMVFFVFE